MRAPVPLSSIACRVSSSWQSWRSDSPRRMHNLSRASGCAICRLLQSEMNGSSECDYEELEKEIAAFAEMARKNLCLDNSSLTAAVMFAQPLVKKWVPRWKFAFTIGVALGTKFTTEGFWTVDIISECPPLPQVSTNQTLLYSSNLVCRDRSLDRRILPGSS